MGTFVLAGIILNGAWTQLDAIGWPAWLLPILILALDRIRPVSFNELIRKPLRPESIAAMLIAAALCGTHLLHVVLTAREEFGFGGDEGYHLSATRAFAIYFMKAGPFLVAVLALYVACRRVVPRIAAAVAMAGLIVSSYFLPNDALFGRYPTAFYLLSTPLNVAFDVARIPYPFTANHIVNMLSLPAWLFVLRPVLFGRWPDWRVVPIALLIYFQAPSITYVSSALLEPWSFVFVLLALEGIVSLEDDRQWIAVLLAGVATLFKDTAILFLPPVWLLAMVEWHGLRPVLRRHAISIGIAAAAPFITYYAIRRGLHIVRGYEIAGSATLWTIERAQQWLTNARVQLGAGGAISVAALATWSAIGIVLHRRAARHHAVWIIAAVAFAIFFAADVASIPFTGYGRFLAYSLLALCGVAFATTYWLADRHRLLLRAIAVLIAALQFFPVLDIAALDLGPDYQRNSLEWQQGLVRFPIRTLIRKLPQLPGGDEVKRIRVILFEIDPISLRVAYPDLARQYDLQGEMQPSTATDCSCRATGEAVVAGFEWPANFGATHEAYARANASAACREQIRRTCTATSDYTDGSVLPVGVIGVRAP